MLKVITSVLFVSLVFLASAQQNDSIPRARNCPDYLLSPALSVATMAGGQVNSAGFYYRSGTSVQLSLRAHITDRLSIGLGGGIEKLQKEWIYPIFSEFIYAFKSTPGSGFFILQTGYSLSYLDAYESFEGYKGSGGFMISPGWGYAIPLKDRTKLFFASQFRQQQFVVEYHNDNGGEYEERFSYSFLMLKIGLQF